MPPAARRTPTHRPSRRPAGAFSMVEMVVALALLGIITALAVPVLRAVQLDNTDNAALAELTKLHNDAHALAAADGTYAMEYHRSRYVELAPGGLGSSTPIGTRDELAIIEGLDEGSTGHGWASFGVDASTIRAALAMQTHNGRCAYVVVAEGAVVSSYATEAPPCRADQARLADGDGALAGTSAVLWPGE